MLKLRPSSRTLLALAMSAVAGVLLQQLNLPLPWLIGPLLCVAVANGFHARVVMPRGIRSIGQWLVGSALGLYFTQPVVEQVAQLFGWIILCVALSMLASALSARVLAHVGGADATTAFFASAIGGAAEMANQAERYGASVDQVAAAQAIRVLMVVLIVPFAFKFSGVLGTDSYQRVLIEFDAVGLIELLAATALCGAILWKLNLPNAWLFGPLAFSAAIAASDHSLSSVPVELTNLGQLLIGCSLGARFAPQFFRDSPRYMAGVIISGLVLLAIGVIVGAMLAHLSDVALPTALLATAPGGLAEMGVTAQVLQLGVPVVTAFHTVRLLTVVMLTGTLYRLISARLAKRQ